MKKTFELIDAFLSGIIQKIKINAIGQFGGTPLSFIISILRFKKAEVWRKETFKQTKSNVLPCTVAGNGTR